MRSKSDIGWLAISSAKPTSRLDDLSGTEHSDSRSVSDKMQFMHDCELEHTVISGNVYGSSPVLYVSVGSTAVILLESWDEGNPLIVVLTEPNRGWISSCQRSMGNINRRTTSRRETYRRNRSWYCFNIRFKCTITRAWWHLTRLTRVHRDIDCFQQTLEILLWGAALECPTNIVLATVGLVIGAPVYYCPKLETRTCDVQQITNVAIWYPGPLDFVRTWRSPCSSVLVLRDTYHGIHLPCGPTTDSSLKLRIWTHLRADQAILGRLHKMWFAHCARIPWLTDRYHEFGKKVGVMIW